MTLFQEMFGKRKAVIAMAHFPPLPGQPLHDRSAGVRGVIDAVRRDLEHLADSGVDAVMFCNEGDRPYRTVAGPETTAVMGAAVAELSRDLPIPFGVDVLWDPKAALALAHATGALFVREVFTGAYAGDFGVWNTDPAETLSFRDRIGADGVKMFYNVTAEFAAPIAPRDIALTARSAVFSSLADAVCVSGVVTGTGVDVAQLRAAKEAVGEVPVIANTGVNPQTVAQMLAIADACIVGTALKRDGVTWNEVDPERVKRLVSVAAESGHWEPARRGGA
ncbi:SgcQ protein [Spongiactinospora gelatinilytica]|uniref:SgcQ protein n=1 Tax=Spongiactinospora gelatinilytica TaxID=2666298 RepID=A0A2W2HY34_9ACTN|nr:BtpA/SgcQ family protein [Spongiactinospora gelatinilytica]PZG55540.1 SgcQ protein [Spongiactinospora gelatinilytica]